MYVCVCVRGGRVSSKYATTQCKCSCLIRMTSRMLPFTSVKLERDVWCWNKNSVTVEILRGQPRPLEFIQTGYRLEYSVDHDISLVSTVLATPYENLCVFVHLVSYLSL